MTNPAAIIQQFSRSDFQRFCHVLARRDPHLKGILQQYGFPPMWSRPNQFATLIHIILEQQVSLASARAAFLRLKKKTGGITPERLLSLTDEELKACYFSRQKMVYARHLATAFQTGQLATRKLRKMPDEAVREALTRVKGVGRWTADIYLIFALQRSDVFPLGDLAMVKSLRQLKELGPDAGVAEMEEIAECWRPYRSVATMLFWHHYLSSRKKPPGAG